MPASLVFKMRTEESHKIAEVKHEKKEKKSGGLFSIFSNGDKKEEKKEDTKKVEIATTSGMTELPPAETVKIGECMGKVKIKGELKEVEEVVVITPESRDEKVTPAKYKEVNEVILVKPATKTWKAQDDKGEIMRLVEEPAVYEKKITKVLLEEEKVDVKVTPAVTKTVKKQVLVPTEEEKVEWQPVVCNDKLDRATVKKIQKALKLNADGFYGPATNSALLEHQRSIGIESAGVTTKALETLGVN
jgi:hypothetical protein